MTKQEQIEQILLLRSILNDTDIWWDPYWLDRYDKYWWELIWGCWWFDYAANCYFQEENFFEVNYIPWHVINKGDFFDEKFSQYWPLWHKLSLRFYMELEKDLYLWKGAMVFCWIPEATKEYCEQVQNHYHYFEMFGDYIYRQIDNEEEVGDIGCDVYFQYDVPPHHWGYLSKISDEKKAFFEPPFFYESYITESIKVEDNYQEYKAVNMSIYKPKFWYDTLYFDPEYDVKYKPDDIVYKRKKFTVLI